MGGKEGPQDLVTCAVLLRIPAPMLYRSFPDMGTQMEDLEAGAEAASGGMAFAHGGPLKEPRMSPPEAGDLSK